MQIFERLASTNWPAILTSLGALITFMSRFRRKPRSRHRLRDLIAIHDSLPETARGELVPTIQRLSRSYAEDAERLANRKIDGANLAALVFVTIVGVAGLWGLSWAAKAWSWLFWIGFGIWVALLIAFLAAGLSQLYKEPKGEKHK